MTVEYDHILASTDPDCFVYWLFETKFEELIKHRSFQIQRAWVKYENSGLLFLQRDYREVSLNCDQTEMDMVSSHTPEKKLFPVGKPEKKTIPDSSLDTFLVKHFF